MRFLPFICLCILVTALGCKPSSKDNPNGHYDTFLFDSIYDIHKNEHPDSLTAVFKGCVGKEYPRKEYDKYQGLVSECILQVFNSYQNSGQNEDGVEWLMGIQQSPSGLVKERCMRDLYIISSYALSRIDSGKQAEEMMIKALAMPTDEEDHRNRMRDYAFAASVFYFNAEREADVINWCKLALQHGEKCGNPPWKEYILAMLADVYQRRREIAEALDILNQSLEDVRKKHDATMEVNVLNSIARALMQWKLYAEADEYSDYAVQLIQKEKVTLPVIVGETYMAKGKAAVELCPDSALIWMYRSDSIVAPLAYNLGREVADINIGELLMEIPDSIDNAIFRFQRAAANILDIKKPKTFFSLAKAYHKKGDLQTSIAMLDTMFDLLDAMPDVNAPNGAYLWALKRYTETDDLQRMRRCAKALAQDSSMTVQNQISNSLAKSVVNFRSYNQQQEIKNVQLESRLLFQKWSTGMAITLLVVMLVLAWILYSRIKVGRQRDEIAARQDELIDNLQEEKQNREEDLKRYSQNLDHISKRAVVESFSPGSIRSMGEERFRERFKILYPAFDDKVLATGVRLSKREQMLAMLIIVGFSSPQIADVLGIAKQSVKINRYRLRKKFNLSQEISLDDFLRSLSE